MISAILMPTWGLSMEEGTIVSWLVAEGADVTPGRELVEIETTKITNVLEADGAGILRRQVAKPGEVQACGNLIGVLASSEVPEAEIDAFIAGFAATQTKTETEDAPVESARQITLSDGRALRYRQIGDGGHPVIFIHGFGGDLDSWMFNQPETARQRASYAIDLLGHGGSAKALQSGTVAELADAVGAALEALGLAGAHLIGHSLGGAVALELALRRSDTRSLTLIAAAGLSERIDDGYIADFIAAQRSRDVQRCLGKLFADPKSVSREMAEGVAQYKRLDGVTEALRQIEAACFKDGVQQMHYVDRLAALPYPILVLWGAQDAILSPETLQMLPASVEKHLLADAGHMPQMEQAQRVNELLLRHLAAADARAGA